MTQAQQPPVPSDARAGRCAIVGRPNVGKSTLLNALLGQKLAIATRQPGTTRSCLLGVYYRPDPATQIAFVDTPGIGLSRTALHRSLSDQARSSLGDAEVILLVTDSVPFKPDAALHPGDLAVLETCRQAGRPIVVAINKVDKVTPRDRLLPVLQHWHAQPGVVAVVPTSATKKKNIEAVVDELRQRLPEGLLYEEDTLTDRPMRFFAAELVREAVLERTRDEVPHGIAVLIDTFEESPEITCIEATLVVEKEAHKGIVIGKAGARLKEIGTEARKQIEAFVGQKVFLKLWVKVVPGWTSNPRQVREMIGEADS